MQFSRSKLLPHILLSGKTQFFREPAAWDQIFTHTHLLTMISETGVTEKFCARLSLVPILAKNSFRLWLAILCRFFVPL